MNHIYRIVFNRSLGVYQCVSELAKADGKSSGRSATHCRQSGLILSSLSIAMLSMILIDGAQATTYNGGYYTNLNEPVDKDGNTYPDPYPYPSAYIVGNDVVENVGTELVARYAIVGSSGSGKLTIRDQGKFFSDKVIVGNQLGSDGKVIVNNAGLLVGGYFNQREGKLIIGNYGKGSVTIEKGAFADVDRSIEIGNYENAIGELIVTGANSNLFMDDFLKIGNSGQGKVITADGAVVGVGGQVVVGTDTSGLGELLVTDVDTELFIGDDLIVGKAGKGSARIANGGAVEAKDVSIGEDAGSEANLAITDSNSYLRADGSLEIGVEGTGSVTLAEGALVEANGVSIGLSTDSEGDLTVTGSNSKLNIGSGFTDGSDLFIENDLYIGNEGKGKVTIADGGLVQAKDVHIGKEKDGEGDLTVTGSNSKLSSEDLVIGNKGKGIATIADGGLVQAKYAGIGQTKSSEGELTVIGNNSKLSVDIDLTIGYSGKGSATIADGALVEANSVDIGKLQDGKGDLTVTGNNSKLSVNRDLTVGYSGKGSAVIADGSSIETKYVSIGSLIDSEGDLNVTGSDSKLSAEELIIGEAGKGIATIADEGLVQANVISLGKTGKGTLNIIDNGLVVAKDVSRDERAKSSVINFDNGTLALLEPERLAKLFNNFTADSTINLASGGGTIDTNKFDITVFDDARITGNGSFTKAGTGKLVMNSANKAWTGNTNINQGVLELNGNYIMRKGEILGIGLNSLTDYGQLNVIGKADISKGT
ncbi:ESPR-type extended signal peptide-containing protein, partial [Psychrobacter sp.]|uniref:ESPR-type extended signal peptide-containing protein n=1 Tax=Psychrobacter sp. TaxID=56811 RepID=UPI003566D9A0